LRRDTLERRDRVGSVRRDIRFFTAREGVDTRDQVNNLPLLHRTMYDWVDGVFSTQ
jgi:hypothetical protein